MIRLSTSRLKPGMRIIQGIYNRSGASYLTRGTVLNNQYISKLRKIGIKSVNIVSVDPAVNVKLPPDILQEKTRISAIHQVYDTFAKLQDNEDINIDPVLSSAEQIIYDLAESANSLVQMTDIRLYDDYTFAHSVNVAALSSMMGILCGIDNANLKNLATGALLHDIGKLDIPIDILNKTAPLNDKEYQAMKLHPQAGWKRLQNVYHSVLNMDLISIIAHQHHERPDGTGYPERLQNKQIHKFAKIVSIADVYDALTSQRSYKPAYPPHVAYQIMLGSVGYQFDEELLHTFFDHVALYPIGTVMKTKLGLAIAMESRLNQTRYPIILLFANQNGKPLASKEVIDTKDYGNDFIQNIIDGQDLVALIHHLGFDPAKLLAEAD